MKKLIIFTLFIGLLGACSSSNNTTSNSTYPRYNIPRSVDKIIKGLEGCKKEFVFEVLGLPDDEKIIDEKKYFYWTMNTNDTSFWSGKTKGFYCTIHAQVDENGIVDRIFYKDLSNGCKYRYVQIVRYYRQYPAQSPETCPNRIDLQGDHSIKKGN